MIRAFVKAVILWLVFWAIFILPAYSAEIAIGDSIAVGLRLPGSAQVGESPKAVLTRIVNTPLNRLHDHLVILSTGISNDATQSAYVVWQLAALKAAGAKVILLGVGAEMKQSTEINAWLLAQARYYDFPFLDGWEHVHPDSYPKLLDAIRLLECQDYKICDA